MVQNRYTYTQRDLSVCNIITQLFAYMLYKRIPLTLNLIKYYFKVYGSSSFLEYKYIQGSVTITDLSLFVQD